jgi:hypothetical protein
MRPQCQPLQGSQAKHPGVGMATRSLEKWHQQMSHKEQNKNKLKSRTYILERTRAFFTRRSDKLNSGAAHFDPCSGAARRGPADSGAAPL